MRDGELYAVVGAVFADYSQADRLLAVDYIDPVAGLVAFVRVVFDEAILLSHSLYIDYSLALGA